MYVFLTAGSTVPAQSHYFSLEKMGLSRGTNCASVQVSDSDIGDLIEGGGLAMYIQHTAFRRALMRAI